MNLLASTNSNFAPPLNRPGVSADDSEEATTDAEDDEIKDGDEMEVGVLRVAVGVAVGVAVTQEVDGMGVPEVMVPQVAVRVAITQVMVLWVAA